MREEKQKLLYLESLRGIAAIVVAITHAGTNFAYNSPLCRNLFIMHGHLMVDFFFVLSGFVIAYNYLDRLTDTGSLLKFQARRFLRVYPLHLLTLLAFVGIQCGRYILLQYRIQNGIANPEASFEFGFDNLLHNLLLTHSIFQDHLSFNFPSWSISTEFYTYAIFAAFVFFVRGRLLRRYVSLIMIVGGGYYLYMWNSSGATNGISALIRCLHGFFLGVTIFTLGDYIKKPLPDFLKPVLLALCLAAIYFHRIVPGVLFTLICATLIFALIYSESCSMKRALNHPVLIFCGTISYGIYMWHTAVWYLIGKYYRLNLDIPNVIHPMTGDPQPDLSATVATLTLIIGMGTVFTLAWLSYRFVERPANSLRHRL